MIDASPDQSTAASSAHTPLVATSNAYVVANPWRRLRAFTDARIGLGRAGISLPTARLLEFQLAHAQARDAVHLPLDVDALCQALTDPPALFPAGTPIRLRSRAADRMTYLQRPDHGRRLDETACTTLTEQVANAEYDVAFVVVDGLSSHAVASHAAPFIDAMAQALAGDTERDWRLAPLTVVEQGRVAVGDEVGEALGAACVVVLIGERPGLSSPDSLGLYLTWAPTVGMTDDKRNCISNVHPAGLALDAAARRLLYLLTEARAKQISGVGLKDRSGDDGISHDTEQDNFLTRR